MAKVLIIEDQEAVRRMLQTSITTFGYEVQAAEDGRAGIEICAAWHPDLIITDIFMPEQDGLETIRSLRKTTPNTRIIAMSGGGDMGNMDVLRIARAMGATRVLTKPFRLADLKVLLQETLQDSPAEESEDSAS